MSQKRSIKRVYLPYYAWEESFSNMWGRSENRKEALDKAIKFTGNHNLYGKWMIKVLERWPNSCLHNLSCRSINRKAWIGHAACAIAIDCPEDIVREAWKHLTEDQQVKANRVAEYAINKWEQRYLEESWQKCIWE